MSIPETLRRDAETLADRLRDDAATASSTPWVADNLLGKVSDASIDDMLKRARLPLPGDNLNTWREAVRIVMRERLGQR